MSLLRYRVLSVLSVIGALVCLLVLAQSARAQSGTSGTEMIMRGLGEFSQGMSEINDCRNRFKTDYAGYSNCTQDANKRSNQRSLQWQMELQEGMEADNQKRKEEQAREICADREDDRAWALCMKRYGGR